MNDKLSSIHVHCQPLSKQQNKLPENDLSHTLQNVQNICWSLASNMHTPQCSGRTTAAT